MVLVEVERNLKPYTLNHYFNANQQHSNGERVKQAIESKAFEINMADKSKRMVVTVSRIPEAVTNKSNEQHAKETMHDILKAYYKVACKRFIDNLFLYRV